MHKARFPGFYKLTVDQRLQSMHDNGWITSDDLRTLKEGHHLLDVQRADKMIENVVGVMGLPIGLCLNFLVNAKDYIVPIVVEEPSIVAALSSAAKTFRSSGGIQSEALESLLIGQIQVVNPPDIEEAAAQILNHKHDLMSKLNGLHPNMVTRGGGVKDIEARIIRQTDNNPPMLIVHLLVDTADAMGANIVNTMCEEIAIDVEAITQGRVFLRILSNLTDRAIVRASVQVSIEQLESKGYSGAEVRDGIILASQFAAVDPYRAATNNKGVMNGIDPLAIATGNDWRSLEVAAHAYAARSGRYTALTRWYQLDDGSLKGEIEIPIKVGTEGASLLANDTTSLSQRILGITCARELAELMAAIGLAQNFSAIKALVTEGIQKGHMSLHARSVAATAGAPNELFETVVSRLINEGDIKVQRATEIIAELTIPPRKNEIKHTNLTTATAHGKVILLGEHAVVYGRPAVAVPIPNAVTAEVFDSDNPTKIIVPDWNLDGNLEDSNSIWWSTIKDVFKQLDVDRQQFTIHVKPNIPAAMGLGGSAAIAVVIVRVVEKHFKLGLNDEEVNRFAFLCEKAAHGTPSGIDNTIATYGKPLVYQPGEKAGTVFIDLEYPLNLVIGISGKPSLTVDMVAGVRDRWRKNGQLYEQLFDNIGRVSEIGIQAIKDGDYASLGHMMTINHGLLSAIQVSSPELDRMVQIAKDNDALGAKLTGAGGGGSIVSVCNGNSDVIASALTKAGFKALQVTI